MSLITKLEKFVSLVEMISEAIGEQDLAIGIGFFGITATRVH